MSADDKSGTSRGDEWLRRGAKPRGTIDPEPITREPTPSERMTSAMRAARDRTLRRVAPPTDSTGR